MVSNILQTIASLGNRVTLGGETDFVQMFKWFVSAAGESFLTQHTHNSYQLLKATIFPRGIIKGIVLQFNHKNSP